jgi:hypothetical protein
MKMISQAISHFNGLARQIKALSLKNVAADHHGEGSISLIVDAANDTADLSPLRQTMK